MASRSDDYMLDVEPKNDEKVPEISIIRRNPTSMQLILDISSHFQTLSNNAQIGKRMPVIQAKVYWLRDSMQKKMYLADYGQHLQRVGKFRDSIRFLEAALSIETDTETDNVQKEIIKLLDKAYENTVRFRPELSVLCWEMDLFGTNDSRTMSCESKNGILTAKRDFNKGDVLFIDKPVVGYVQDSMLQCNCCALKTLHTIPCMQCFAVCYCSVECQRKDEHYHKYECLGFHLQFSPITKNVLALRMLVKALDILKQNLLLRKHALHKPETPQQLWEVLLENHTHSADFLEIFQLCTCNHFSAERELYHTVLQTVPQITHYIAQDKQLLEDYKLCWMGLTHDCCTLFLESVLLRLLFVTKSRSCCFSYVLAFKKTDYGNMLLLTGATGDETRDYKFTADPFVMGENQYKGMYRFQSEMLSSRTNYNTITVLLDHGAVAFRAADEIKKGDKLIFTEASTKDVAYLHAISSQEIYVLASSNSGLCTEKVIFENHIKIWSQLIKSKAKIFTEDHFLDLLLLFDRFITLYHKLPKKQSCIVTLYQTINMLEVVYQEARMIPLVLMQDEWMVRLIYRYGRLRAIKDANTINFINYMYDMYFLD
ncbi:uncharacterized protein LOC125770019 [Anopheles funestus]|uniref:uncharacterized protein LOC125770019 n=1 Tax=Anopheles funestus TaxID=62324 RepID=UPI0020C689A5|nr:uncharacterized protein LOC125770019 [Anopheles funestus]